MVKIIDNLFDRSRVTQRARHLRSGTEVYSIERRNGVITLFHYGTKTLEVEHGEIRHLYGISRSDVDSINTLLHNLKIYSFGVGFKPVNGGFYAWIKEPRKEVFLNNYDTSGFFAKDIQRHLTEENTAGQALFKNYSEPMPAL